MKNKMLTIILIVLVCVTLVGVVFLALWLSFGNDFKAEAVAKEPTIDEIVEASVDVPEITTNIGSRQFIRISLKIQTENVKAAEELTKREFQVKNIVIQELSEMTAKDLEGKAGKQAFENALKSYLNPLMQTGQVERVYIVSYIIQ
ncbi:flagellar basal body-associated protein FliL [Sporosarcina sp. FA9]|uniref:flagellar basal body-associated protein FliL n=1 Tax=Sporosarcina sp. FA9 TaxID=3413030 RepID=UPI003F660C37